MTRCLVTLAVNVEDNAVDVFKMEMPLAEATKCFASAYEDSNASKRIWTDFVAAAVNTPLARRREHYGFGPGSVTESRDGVVVSRRKRA